MGQLHTSTHTQEHMLALHPFDMYPFGLLSRSVHDELFHASLPRDTSHMELSETEHGYAAHVTAPGVKTQDLNVSISEDAVLTIAGRPRRTRTASSSAVASGCRG